jgi:8-oxo-dGTP pyrophosphatase MutT (NUDIX family)
VSLHADALSVLAGWAAPDAEQERLRRRYVEHLDRHRDGLSRSCLPDHITASTLIIDADGANVLLTQHAKSGDWYQTGGHCEPTDTSLSGAALREATEESGIATLSLDPVPVQLDLHDVPFCGPDGRARHLDVRFVAVAPPGAVHAVSAESLDVRWWPADVLPNREPGLRRLVELARERLAQSTSPSSSC